MGVFGVITGGAEIKHFTVDETCAFTGKAFMGVIGGSNDGGTIIIDGMGNLDEIKESISKYIHVEVEGMVYEGTLEEWNNIQIFTGNDYLTNALSQNMYDNELY